MNLTDAPRIKSRLRKGVRKYVFAPNLDVAYPQPNPLNQVARGNGAVVTVVRDPTDSANFPFNPCELEELNATYIIQLPV